MASTYSTNLKLQLMTTGENLNSWGSVTNTNLGTALEEAIGGTANVTFSSADVTLTLSDNPGTQTARNMRLNLTGVSGGARDLNVPAIEKMYIVYNGLSDACTVKVSGQTGVTVPVGKTMLLINNGTDVVDAVTHLSSLTLASALPVASGGTGVTTSTGTGSVVLSASPALTGNPTAPTQSAGDNSTKIATTQYVDSATGSLGTLASQNANNVSISGGAITGTSINSITVGSNGSGTRTISTSAPSGGSSGDIHYRIS
jgi:hypothetical protein